MAHFAAPPTQSSGSVPTCVVAMAACRWSNQVPRTSPYLFFRMTKFGSVDDLPQEQASNRPHHSTRGRRRSTAAGGYMRPVASDSFTRSFTKSSISLSDKHASYWPRSIIECSLAGQVYHSRLRKSMDVSNRCEPSTLVSIQNEINSFINGE